jgi:hypothetical protein
MNIEQLYQEKIASAHNRNLSFNLSLEEFKHLYALRNTERCAYTNKTFVLSKGTSHEHYPTLERINADQPYSLENLVWVTHIANQVKNIVVDQGKPFKPTTIEQENLVKSLTKLFNSPEVLVERQKPYLAIKTNIAKENIRLANEAKERNRQLQEVEVAKMYSEWGSTIVSSGGKLLVTFSDYKRKLQRTKCQLTGEVLPEAFSMRSMWVKDKSLPVTKDNIICTTKIIQESLDTFEVKSKLCGKEAAKVFSGVVKSWK